MKTNLTGVVHKERGSAYGVSFPELPNPVLITADRLDDRLLERIRDVLTSYCEETGNEGLALRFIYTGEDDGGINGIDSSYTGEDIAAHVECEIEPQGEKWRIKVRFTHVS